jgi:predicted ester cyclase
MAADNNTELVLRMYEEFDRGALEIFTDAVSPNFKATILGTTTLDWAGFKAFGEAFVAAFPDGRHVFEQVVTDGDNVVTIGSYRGTHKGELQGIAATNSLLKLPVMHLDRVIDGRIVEHRGMANELDFMRQLGVSRA